MQTTKGADHRDLFLVDETKYPEDVDEMPKRKQHKKLIII